MRVYRVIFALIAAILALSIGTQAVAPGIQSGVSIGAVQRLVNKVLPPMLNIVKNTKFPDVSHEEKKQKGYLYSPTFKQLDIGSFVAQVANGKFTVGIRDLHLELHAGWRVKIKKLVWISTHGNVDARFSASQILATFNFGTRDIGAGKFKPTVGVSSVNVDFTNTKIKISRNILAWFVNLLTSFLKNKIRSAVNTAVRDALQGGLSTLATRMTDAIPTSLALGTLGSINLGVTSPISTPGNNVLALAFDGQITSRAGHVGIADRHSVPFTPTGRMLDLFIDTFVLNSGSDAAFKSKTFSAVAHGNAPPAGLTIPMIGSSLDLPQLNEAGHGSKFLRVTAHPVEAFRINSATNALSAVAKVDLHIDINLGNGNYIEALVVRCESSGSVNVSFGNVAGTPILSPKLNSLGATFSTVRSSFGTVTFGKLNAFLGQLLNGVVVPAVNTFVLQPIPIPTTIGLTLANPAISFRQNHIYAGFDVDFNL